MSEKKITLGYLGYKFQTELINQLLHPANKKFSDRIIDILHANYFDNEYFRLIIATIKDYFERFEKIPAWDTLETILKVEIKDKISQDYVFEICKEIRDLDVEDWEYVQIESLNFCRQQELKKANDKISKIIDNGEFGRYEECAEIMKEALSVGAEKDDGTSITEGWDTVLEEDFRHPVPTGISGIDELTDGGLSRGELGVVLAPYGVGKTTILTKIANTAYNVGANVLQIVFEDKDTVIKRKHAACWSGIELNALSDDKEKVFEVIKDKTEGRENDLIIRKFPSEGITVNHIKTYVRHLISTGFKPDMIVLDYIDCVESTRRYNDEWSDVVTGDQMGGSIKKAQIGHFIMSIARTLAQKEGNRATIAVLKSRFGKDGVLFEDCTFDNGRVYIDTETSDTFLGYERKVEVRKEENARERLKMARLRKEQRNSETNQNQ
jgi:replicative DNA helicase